MLFRKKTTNLETLVKSLDTFKQENNCAFIKVYFADDENYSIKLIDENEKLIKTFRKNKSYKARAFDLKKEKRYENRKN